MGINSPIFHSHLSSPLWHGVMCQAAMHFPCHPVVLFDRHISFLLVAFSCATSWLTIVVDQWYLCVSHTFWHCWNTCIHLHTHNKVIHRCLQLISPLQVSLSLHLGEPNMSLTAILSQWIAGTNTRGAHALDLYSYLWEEMSLVILRPMFFYIWHKYV
jgi:hypothetical protein